MAIVASILQKLRAELDSLARRRLVANMNTPAGPNLIPVRPGKARRIL